MRHVVGWSSEQRWWLLTERGRGAHPTAFLQEEQLDQHFVVKFEVTVDQHGTWRAELQARNETQLLALARALVWLLEDGAQDGKVGPDVEIGPPQP